MAKRQEDYLTLSAILRAREPKMLNKDKAVRMLEAATFEDAAKTLTDCGYEDMSQMNAREIEESLEQHRKDIYAELVKLSPDSTVTDLFRSAGTYKDATGMTLTYSFSLPKVDGPDTDYIYEINAAMDEFKAKYL